MNSAGHQKQYGKCTTPCIYVYTQMQQNSVYVSLQRIETTGAQLQYGTVFPAKN